MAPACRAGTACIRSTAATRISFSPTARFPSPSPTPRWGPIFLHAESCPRHADNGEVPDMLRSPQYILRGYNADDRIVYGSGQIVPTPEIPHVAARMFSDARIAYVHVRSASNNCYQCRIDRA